MQKMLSLHSSLVGNVLIALERTANLSLTYLTHVFLPSRLRNLSISARIYVYCARSQFDWLPAMHKAHEMS